jgi:hypothetical protein
LIDHRRYGGIVVDAVKRIGRFIGTVAFAVATVSVPTPSGSWAAEAKPTTPVETFNGIADGDDAPDPAAAATVHRRCRNERAALVRRDRHPGTTSNTVYEAGATVDNRLLVW